jgi:hypothetical protein
VSWRLDVVTGLAAGFVFAALTRFVGIEFPISALEGTAFAIMWILTGLFLRR